MKKRLYIFWGAFLQLICSYGQNPHLRFQIDSLGIGDRVAVSLVYKHQGENEIFFPDERTSFQPFEFLEKEIFPTITRDSVSTDSAIFYLRTFRTDSILPLRLPVYFKQGKDSSVIWSNTDHIYFRGMIPDSLLSQTTLLSDTGAGVSFVSGNPGKSFYITLFLILGILLGLLFFKSRIWKWWELVQLNRRHREFHHQFRVYMQEYKNVGVLNSANIHWRNYMEELEGEPFTSLSAREIERQTGNEQVGHALRELESALFGGRESDRIPLALQILSKYARDQFKIRKLQFKRNRKNGRASDHFRGGNPG